MKTGVPTNGKQKGEPHLYRNGRGIHGWKADKAEAKERRQFKRLSPRQQAIIEARKLDQLRETMNGILD